MHFRVKRRSGLNACAGRVEMTVLRDGGEHGHFRRQIDGWLSIQDLRRNGRARRINSASSGHE